MKYILSVDQGTTSSRAIIFDEKQKVIAESQREYKLSYPKDGWVEANPRTILDTVKEVINEVLTTTGVKVACCGITNQRESVVVWNKHTGEEVYPAIIWQDRRTSEFCRSLALKKPKFEKQLRQKTGLLLDPYFSATKIQWILKNVSGAMKLAQKGDLCCGTIDSFLVWHLTEENNHLTDVSNASRTMLMDIRSCQWDQELLREFDIPESMLPEIKNNDYNFGTIKSNHSFPITGVIGDQQSALFGQDCLSLGDMKITFGTGCFLMVNTLKEIVYSKSNLLTTVGYQIGSNKESTFSVEGSIYSAGSAIQWLRDGLKVFDNTKHSENFINSNFDSGGVKFVPAFTGLGAPHWNSSIRASFQGIQRDTSINDLVTSVFKSICFQTREIVEALNIDGIEVNKYRVDGGMIKNNLFLQMLSDTLNKEIIIPNFVESTALGAYKMACVGSKISLEGQKSYSITSPNQERVTFMDIEYKDWKKNLKNLISIQD